MDGWHPVPQISERLSKSSIFYHFLAGKCEFQGKCWWFYGSRLQMILFTSVTFNSCQSCWAQQPRFLDRGLEALGLEDRIFRARYVFSEIQVFHGEDFEPSFLNVIDFSECKLKKNSWSGRTPNYFTWGIDDPPICQPRFCWIDESPWRVFNEMLILKVFHIRCTRFCMQIAILAYNDLLKKGVFMSWCIYDWKHVTLCILGPPFGLNHYLFPRFWGDWRT